MEEDASAVFGGSVAKQLLFLGTDEMICHNRQDSSFLSMEKLFTVKKASHERRNRRKALVSWVIVDQSLSI